MALANVSVLAASGPGVGLGHLSRAGAVAAALRAQGHRVATCTPAAGAVEHDGIAWEPLGGAGDDTPPPGDGPLLVDVYGADLAALSRGRRLATFWDGTGAAPDADLALTLAGPEGLQLACLRPMFWGGGTPRAPRREARRVLVTTGGGAAGGVAALAAAVRDATGARAEVAAILGPYADEQLPDGVAAIRAPGRMVDVLQDADVVVASAGQSMLEALCAGTPCVALAVADNQRAQLRLVADAGAVRVAAGGPDDAAAQAAALLADPTARTALAAAGRALVDGFGALRVAARVAAL
jgi:spore coat polysaccharide biosynthesis predicted glycosyltransferase SpsG